jgi:hypothetical protein
MAKLAAVDAALQQHGHALAESRFEKRIGVDVDFDDRRARLRGKRRKRRTQVIAQVTVGADEQRQRRRDGGPAFRQLYCSPGFSVV